MTQQIRALITSGSLPEDGSVFLKSIQNEDGTFVLQEGILWDFKREWPFSYSDEYFASIARLICAFANTHGGIIVFGVHDETRKPGHNKVNPNLDRLVQALNSLLSDTVSLQCRRYGQRKSDVDILLVSPNNGDKPPLRFAREISKYKAGIIWVRSNHEVIQAEPRHISLLYCKSPGKDQQEDDMILGGLPPSPATIKRFVGRIQTVDRVFKWLKTSDEPRTYLYGKGGSGKTTIAYEVARVLKLEGFRTKIYGDEQLDNVIFLSAKQKSLDVLAGKEVDFIGLDFSSERELYEAILTLANWTTEPIGDMTIETLRNEIREFFNLTCNFVVIDDIDTLTTRGKEAGSDFLYGVLWRAKRRSKILYTIRAAPSISIANSIEVLGLQGQDYDEFVRVCAEQFNVQMPDQEVLRGRLAEVSERRPLVLENIIALRRTAGTYEKAIQLFEESGGEDVRNYVFQREWNALPPDNHGRYVLAILALHGEPVTFADIVALSRYEETSVRDALTDVREMFLQLNEVGSETLYQLGALTKAFVAEQSKRLDHYEAIKQRVEKYKRNFYPQNPILSRIRDRVEALIFKAERFGDAEALKQAIQIVSDKTLSPQITEDPRFTSLQAFVYVSQTPPNLEEARRLFGHVVAMKFEPEIEHIRKWFFAERNSGHGLDQCIKISDLVCNGKRYADEIKIEYLSRKATNLYTKGRNDIGFTPDKALVDIENSLKLHLICFSKNFDFATSKTEKSEEYARNTAFYLFDFFVHHGQHERFFSYVSALLNDREVKLDPIEDPLVRAFQYLPREKGSKADLNRIKNRLDTLKKQIESIPAWHDTTAAKRVGGAIEIVSARVASNALKSR